MSPPIKIPNSLAKSFKDKRVTVAYGYIGSGAEVGALNLINLSKWHRAETNGASNVVHY
jgi:hypothetical protein